MSKIYWPWVLNDLAMPLCIIVLQILLCEQFILPSQPLSTHSCLLILSLGQCLLPKTLLHGHVNENPRNIFIEGDNILYSCDEGYRSEFQSPKATCTKDDWDPILHCISVSLLPLYLLSNILNAASFFLP